MFNIEEELKRNNTGQESRSIIKLYKRKYLNGKK